MVRDSSFQKSPIAVRHVLLNYAQIALPIILIYVWIVHKIKISFSKMDSAFVNRILYLILNKIYVSVQKIRVISYHRIN